MNERQRGTQERGVEGRLEGLRSEMGGGERRRWRARAAQKFEWMLVADENSKLGCSSPGVG